MLHRALTPAHLLVVISFQTFDSVPFFSSAGFLRFCRGFPTTSPIVHEVLFQGPQCVKKGPDRRNTCRPQGERTATVVLHHVLPGFETSRGENRKLLAFFAQRWCSTMCSLVPRFETSRGENRKLLIFFAQRWCSTMCSLVPRFETSRGENRKLLAFFAQRWCSTMCSLVPRSETHSRMCVDLFNLGGWFSTGDLPSKSGALFGAAAAYKFAPVKIRPPNGHAEVCFGLSSSSFSSVPIVFHCFILHKFVRLKRAIWRGRVS